MRRAMSCISTSSPDAIPLRSTSRSTRSESRSDCLRGYAFARERRRDRSRRPRRYAEAARRMVCGRRPPVPRRRDETRRGAAELGAATRALRGRARARLPPSGLGDERSAPRAARRRRTDRRLHGRAGAAGKGCASTTRSGAPRGCPGNRNGRAYATAGPVRRRHARRAHPRSAARPKMSSMERKELGDRQLDALLERLDRLCDEVHGLTQRLDTQEQMIRISRELATLNESLQALAEPPSPMPTYSRPSGPNSNWPPLWFGYGCLTKRICRAVESTALPFRERNSTIRVSPLRSV